LTPRGTEPPAKGRFRAPFFSRACLGKQRHEHQRPRNVGLVTATCLAEIGNDVVCFDVDAAKIDHLVSGGTPIHERDLPS